MSEQREISEEQTSKQRTEYHNIGRLWFGNGTEAYVVAVMDHGTNTKGEPVTRYIIKPLRNCIFFHNIQQKEYNIDGTYTFDVEKKFIILINQDPSNLTWLSTIDLRQRKTMISSEPYIEQKEREISNAEETKRYYSALNAKLTQELRDITSGDFKEELIDSIVSAVQNAIAQAAQNSAFASLGSK